jgi:DNA-directed RNA polymerase specialized sigma24 family protein
LETLRGPLTGYCYRLLGAVDEVADAVQETMLRAYRSLDRYDRSRAGFSTWVHTLATSVCLDMLRGASRRALPWDLGPAANGSFTLGQYRPDRDGVPRPFALLVLELRGDAIAQIVTFLGWGDRFPDFGLPPRV